MFEPIRGLYIGREIEGFLHAIDEDHDIVGLLPGVEVVQHFVEDNAQAPDVAFDGIGVAHDDLRRHVDRCSH